MRIFLFLLLGVVAMITFSCVDRYEEVEVRKSVIPHTFAEDLRIVNKFMVIDTVNYSYSVSITDSIILAEGIFEDNLIPIFENIDELNEKIKESIRKGLRERGLSHILLVVVMNFHLRMRRRQAIALLPLVGILHCHSTEEIGIFLRSLLKVRIGLRAHFL